MPSRLTAVNPRQHLTTCLVKYVTQSFFHGHLSRTSAFSRNIPCSLLCFIQPDHGCSKRKFQTSKVFFLLTLCAISSSVIIATRNNNVTNDHLSHAHVSRLGSMVAFRRSTINNFPGKSGKQRRNNLWPGCFGN